MFSDFPLVNFRGTSASLTDFPFIFKTRVLIKNKLCPKNNNFLISFFKDTQSLLFANFFFYQYNIKIA